MTRVRVVSVSPPRRRTTWLRARGVQRDRLGRRAGGGPELGGLHHGPLGQLGPRDAGREAEVVLDPRCRGRLATGGHGVEDLGAQALGSSVDGGGQAGRTGADHHQIVQLGRGSGGALPDQRGQLGGVGVAQHLVPPDHHRSLGGRDAEGPQQRLGVRVGLQVHEPVRQPVARRELAQPAGVGREPGPDDAEAVPLADGQGAPDQVGAQDLVAERGIPQQALAQPVRGHLEHLAGVQHDRREERDLPGEQAQLAEEPARPVHPHDLLLRGAERLDDRDPAGEHDDERLVGAALDDEQLAARGRPPRPVAAQHPDPFLAQPRVGAGQVGCLAGWRRGQQLLDIGGDTDGLLRHTNASST